MELASRMGKVDLEKLVAKCGGILKIVSAISKVSWSLLENLNNDFILNLETRPEFHSLSGLLSWMHSYFDDCSDLVKPCLLYLSVFPASRKIRRRRLLRRWSSEGYSTDTAGCTAKENAQSIFSELMKLSIIQQGKNKHICQVNGFIREYISRPMEDNLVFALDGCCSTNMPRIALHLTILVDWQRDPIVFESIDITRLRSLTVFGTWCSFFISYGMTRLRVLDLEDVIDLKNDDVEPIFVMLLSLKFISLRGCRMISRLPDTLGGLRQLQTLDVRFTSIVMLPSSIIKLQKLQYIRAGTEQDWTSASLEDGYGVTSQLPVATLPELVDFGNLIASGRPTVPTSPENDIAESSAQGAASLQLEDPGSTSSGRPTVPTSPRNGITESPAQEATSPEAQNRSVLPKVGWASRFPAVTWGLCGSKREKESRHLYGGVQVPVGIEKLAALHTVGVVNINAAGGKAFLKQLTRLTQLLKLRVCGINKKNWPLLCSALSDYYCQLESLSVRFNEDCIDDSFKPPKTLKSLKLYGAIKKLPDTIKDLDNLKKLDLEMTITRPDGMHLFLREKLPRNAILNRLCIKLQGDHKVVSYSSHYNLIPRVLKIDCSSKLEVTLTYGCIFKYVEVLIIQYSKGSSFGVSGSDGLNHIEHLKTVWLKGSYSEEVRQQLKELVDRHRNKPVLKLEPLQ